MEYYSDVYIAIQDRGYKKMLTRIREDEMSDVFELLKCAEATACNGVVYLKFEWIKWYGSRVDYIQYFLDNELTGEDGEAYKLISIGEDNAICEEDNGWMCGVWVDLDVVIDVDYPRNGLEIDIGADFEALDLKPNREYPDFNTEDFNDMLSG